jgi:hypothetical protein
MKNLLFLVILLFFSFSVFPQSQQENVKQKKVFKPYLNIWTSAQLDIIYDIKQMDRAWIGGFRPSKIPIYSTDPGWGSNGNLYFSVRASTFKFEGVLPSSMKWGDFKLRFEFDLFAMGASAGEQEIRLRLAYGKWGPLLIGREWSTFIDLSCFPNNFEWWGPSGMALAPANMVRFTQKINKNNKMEYALEIPSENIDPGFQRQVDPNLLSVNPKTLLPTIVTRYTISGKWGHLKIANILRMLSYESVSPLLDTVTSHNKFGWALNITSNIHTGNSSNKWYGVFKLQTVFGHGYAGYNNDGGVELARGKGKKVVVPFQYGFSAFYDLYYKDRWGFSTGYSQTQLTNSDGQSEDAWHYGNYTVTQVTYNVFPDRLQVGLNFQYGKKELKGGDNGTDMRVLFTGRYIFNYLPKEQKKK